MFVVVSSRAADELATTTSNLMLQKLPGACLAGMINGVGVHPAPQLEQPVNGMKSTVLPFTLGHQMDTPRLAQSVETFSAKWMTSPSSPISHCGVGPAAAAVQSRKYETFSRIRKPEVPVISPVPS